MSQRDAASDDGQQSGFGIRASKSTCVPPGDGGGKGKHGLCSGEEQLGVGATVGYVVQGVRGCTGTTGAVVAQIQKEELAGRRKAGIGVA